MFLRTEAFSACVSVQTLSIWDLRFPPKPARKLTDRLFPFHIITEKVWSPQTNYLQPYIASHISFMRGETTWYSTFDAEEALNLILQSLDVNRLLPNERGTETPWLECSLALIPRFWAMLGGGTREIRDKLLTIFESVHYPIWNSFIVRLWIKINERSSFPEAESVYKTFSEARKALGEDEYTVARKNALSC